MTKSKVFVLVIFAVLVVTFTIFLCLPEKENTKKTAVDSQSLVQETLDLDDETSGIVKTKKQEVWTVFDEDGEYVLDITTMNDFQKKSDLVIPAEYDGKKIKRFRIGFDNDDVTTLKNVTIEEGIESINSGFPQCSKLEKVVIPKSVKSIEEGEFFYSKDTVTLYVEKNSYAEKYAKKSKLKYKYYKK